MTAALAGVGVVVTRPRARAGDLIAGLEARGAAVVALPTIEIEPITQAPTLAALRDAVGWADWLAFVSPSAVEVALDRLDEAGIAQPPARVAAVGAGTARTLHERGWRVDVCPDVGGSAAELLATPGFAPLAGRECVILTGEDGRRVLPDGLAARGARVTELAVYRRALPALDPAPAIRGWQRGSLQYTIVTSQTGLEHLLTLVGTGGRPAVCASRVITVSARIAERASALGFRSEPVVAARPDDGGLIEALCRAVLEARGATHD